MRSVRESEWVGVQPGLPKHILRQRINEVVPALMTEGAKLCSNNIHLNLSVNMLRPLVKHASKIILLTTNDIKATFTEVFNFDKDRVLHIPIPGEHKFEKPNREYKPLVWQRFNEVTEELDNEAGPVELLLYGSGVAGKVFGAFFKAKGGVALDIGSLCDFWAGRITRGLRKGEQLVSLLSVQYQDRMGHDWVPYLIGNGLVKPS